MPAIITSLVSSLSPGQPYTLNGSGFGAADPASVVVVYPVLGFEVETVTDSWSATVITGTLPEDLVPGDEFWLYIQLVGESSGTTSNVLTVGPIVVPAYTEFEPGTKVSIDNPTATDVGGDPIPSGPATKPLGDVLNANPTTYDVQWAEDPQRPDGLLGNATIAKNIAVKLGTLTTACQQANGVFFFSEIYHPS